MKRVFVCFLALIVLCGLAQAQQTPVAKKRVAIFAFDTTSVIGDVAQIKGESLGNKIADLLLIKVVQNGTYSVIERKVLEKIMAEQDFKYSDRFDRSSVARLGKTLGVDGIIVGEVTHASDKTKCSNFRVKSVGLGGCTEKAVVGISARLVSTETAEIIGVAEAKAEDKKEAGSEINVRGSGGGSSGSQGGNGEAFSEAVHKAVGQLVAPLAAVEPKLPSVQRVQASNSNQKQPVAPARTPEVKTPIAQPKPTTNQTANRFAVEFGTYTDQTEARKRAGQLMVAGVDAQIVPVVVPQRGTWYGVQTGSFLSKDAALKHSVQLKAKGITAKCNVIQVQ